MFSKILIANRGEIACRVMRTARSLGVRTVAVYSDADKRAMHVAMADEAVRVGPPPAAESYLNAEAIIVAAKRTGAEAIHPGYGFLSENALFAEACVEAGIVFIGPPAGAIRAMGSKSAAKAIMEAAAVPLVSGYHGEDQDRDLLAAEAGRIGYPVMIKASAGGGGRGMRIVEQAKSFLDALDGAKRESRNAFGDDRVLIEKYVTRPRHIEIQVFADGHGNVVYLFERDCSIQRRHQKIIEEAPAPGMDGARRAEMGEAACEAARAIDYVGAGTVEFIADQDGNFYFMEMNTRLQVEHPVTELITGQDLVAWQLQVASGGALPLDQDALQIDGHAIEARIYAEDPARDFLPQTGRLLHLIFPEASDHVRVDTGVRTEDEVSIHYDPMIAKLIVWDRDRKSAVRRLSTALADTKVVGLASNVSFLGMVVGHPAFAEGHLDTGFIARYHDDLFLTVDHADANILSLAALFLLLSRSRAAEEAAARSGDRHSPWHLTDGWRLNDDNHHVMEFQSGDLAVSVTVHYRQNGFEFEIENVRRQVSGRIATSGELVAEFDGLIRRATVVRDNQAITVITDDGTYPLALIDPMADLVDDEIGRGGLTAPMPGKVIQVAIAMGETVTKGQTLMVLEAMKMEHTIVAPADGKVETVHFQAGEQVEEGAALISFEAAEA